MIAGQEKPTPYAELLATMCTTYENKNTDYGNSFDQSCNEFGLISPAIRMSDKLNRFKTLIKHQQMGVEQMVKNEKIEDTLIDLANYALMTVLWIRNENKRKESLGV